MLTLTIASKRPFSWVSKVTKYLWSGPEFCHPGNLSYAKYSFLNVSWNVFNNSKSKVKEKFNALLKFSSAPQENLAPSAPQWFEAIIVILRGTVDGDRATELLWVG